MQEGTKVPDEKLSRMIEIGTTFAARLTEDARAKIPLHDELYPGVAMFFFLKAYRTYCAVALLARHLDPNLWLIVGRTIFEILLQAEWMQRDPQTRAVQFREFAITRTRHLSHTRENTEDHTTRDCCWQFSHHGPQNQTEKARA
jgi:hypothetical protein